jgi:hypothetical protein
MKYLRLDTIQTVDDINHTNWAEYSNPKTTPIFEIRVFDPIPDELERVIRLSDEPSCKYMLWFDQGELYCAPDKKTQRNPRPDRVKITMDMLVSDDEKKVKALASFRNAAQVVIDDMHAKPGEDVVEECWEDYERTAKELLVLLLGREPTSAEMSTVIDYGTT